MHNILYDNTWQGKLQREVFIQMNTHVYAPMYQHCRHICDIPAPGVASVSVMHVVAMRLSCLIEQSAQCIAG